MTEPKNSALKTALKFYHNNALASLPHHLLLCIYRRLQRRTYNTKNGSSSSLCLLHALRFFIFLLFLCCSTRLLFTLFDDDSFVPDYSSSRAFAILYSFLLLYWKLFFWCYVDYSVNTIQTIQIIQTICCC